MVNDVPGIILLFLAAAFAGGIAHRYSDRLGRFLTILLWIVAVILALNLIVGVLTIALGSGSYPGVPPHH